MLSVVSCRPGIRRDGAFGIVGQSAKAVSWQIAKHEMVHVGARGTEASQEPCGTGPRERRKGQGLGEVGRARDKRRSV